LRARLAVVFVALVLLPLFSVGWLVLRMRADERAVASVELSRVFEGRLADLDATIEKTTSSLERQLTKFLEATADDVDARRAAVRAEPLARAMFVLDGEGRLLFPPEDDTSSQREKDFLTRTRAIWDRRAILYDRPPEQGDAVTTVKGRGDSLRQLAERKSSGWVTWYWQEGLHLLFWQKRADGGVHGVEIERIVLLSRLIGQLPDVEVDGGRVVLQDSRDDPVYQWGSYEPNDAPPVAVRTLAYPLDSWRLAFYLSSDQQAQLVGARTETSTLVLGFGGLVAALLLFAVYFYRESSRDLREAAARVTFVTQVSHELKTPLANIRLYAELLEARLEDEDPEAVDRLQVIVAESHRLTRLINNILTYARQRRSALALEKRPVVIDAVVERVLEQFGPALEEKRIDVVFQAGAPEPIEADEDALGQIVANLVSNVEKYAPNEAQLSVTTVQDDDGLIVTVHNDGPTIDGSARERIFAPFYRVSSKLTDGVTGTGIGLSIARELAKRHGGDLRCLPVESGATFELRLPRGGSS
jgi:signal transduction histidine kinase